MGRSVNLFALAVVKMRHVERKVYRYHLHPTENRVRKRARTSGCARYVYTRALASRTAAWLAPCHRLDCAATDRPRVRMKREPEKAWFADASRGPHRQAPQRVRKPW